MKRILFFTYLLMAAFSAIGCGGSESYPMCDCNFDEICVEEECKKIPPDFEPAPSDE